MRDVWKLTGCTDVWLSFHDRTSWKMQPHSQVHMLTLELVHRSIPAVNTSAGHYLGRQIGVYTHTRSSH